MSLLLALTEHALRDPDLERLGEVVRAALSESAGEELRPSSETIPGHDLSLEGELS